MRRVVLEQPHKVVFCPDVEAPKAEDLKGNEILLNIKHIGICGSEIHSYHGTHPSTMYPVVQGHEYSGVVVAVGPAVTKFRPGQNVTCRPQLVCGQCNPCRRGQYNVCEHLKVQAFQADGAAQDYFVVTEDRVVALPEGMSLTYGAMVEPTAVGAHATSRPRELMGKNVIVSGAGTIGNLVAQFCIARGAKKVVITDVSDYRLGIAQECGIRHTLNVAKTPIREALPALFGDEGYQVGIECAGVESSLRSLMETRDRCRPHQTGTPGNQALPVRRVRRSLQLHRRPPRDVDEGDDRPVGPTVSGSIRPSPRARRARWFLRWRGTRCRGRWCSAGRGG